jgi:hypothetical protein
VAFFLPWFQISCGPVAVTISGYEIASGSYQEKLSPEHYDQFHRRLEAAMDQASKRGKVRKAQPTQHPPQRSEPEPRTGQNDPVLWIVPGACGALFLLGLLGVPRVPTLLVSVTASAYVTIIVGGWENGVAHWHNHGWQQESLVFGIGKGPTADRTANEIANGPAIQFPAWRPRSTGVSVLT